MKKKLVLSLMFVFSVAQTLFAQIPDSLEASYPSKISTEKCEGDNPCSADNIIFTPGTKFIYSYHFLKDKKEFRCALTPGPSEKDKNVSQYNWKLVTLDASLKEKFAVHRLTTEVLSKKGGLNIPEKDQTIIQHKYRLIDKDLPEIPAEYENSPTEWVYPLEITGLIENKENVWMHFHRDFAFRTTMLNPIPYAQLPLTKGKKWRWKQLISDYWSDSNLLSWKDYIMAYYDYEVTDQTEITTAKFGRIKCTVITGFATLQTIDSNMKVDLLAKTKLKAYYNEGLGFVRLDYDNIDGTQLLMELESVEKE